MSHIVSDIFSRSHSRGTIVQLARFGLTGIFTASLDFCTLVALTELGHLNYLVSAPIGFLLGSTANYGISVLWVFKSGRFSRRISEFTAFLIFTILGVGLNQIVMFLCVDVANIYYALAKSISIGVVTLFNYLTKKFVVFKY